MWRVHHPNSALAVLGGDARQAAAQAEQVEKQKQAADAIRGDLGVQTCSARLLARAVPKKWG